MTTSKTKTTLKRKNFLFSLYPATLITLFSISFWSIFVLFFRPLYRWSISWFHIEQISHYPRKKLMSNYNALIDYYYPWVKGNLALPSLRQSVHGIQHFAEVKVIFNSFILIVPITAILFIVYIFFKKDRLNVQYLKTASIMLAIAPFILSSGFIIDFDRTFTLFHQICFHNDYWLFDPNTDPIILMLPEQFFMLSAIVIIAFQFITSLYCFLLYKRFSKAENN